MNGVMGQPPGAATDTSRLANSRTMLFLLVLMTGVAPISVYMLVPALPVLATTFGWRAIFYLITAASLAITIMIAVMLPETRRDRVEGSSFLGDVGSLIRSRAFIGYVLCQVLASQMIFAFAGGGPYIVVT